MIAKLIAVAVHEVIAEYRKLEAGQADQAEGAVPEAPAPEPASAYDPASTTALTTERAASWDHDAKPPVRAFGFASTPRP